MKAVLEGSIMSIIKVLIIVIMTSLLTTAVYYFNNEVPQATDLAAIIFIMAIVSNGVIELFDKPKDLGADDEN